MEIVYKAGNIIEAHIVAGMLNACEIPTYVGGHFLQGAVGDLSPNGFANVFVASELRVPQALKSLDFLDAARDVGAHAVVLPAAS